MAPNPDADAIRAQAELENQRQVFRLARELDQNSLTRQARESWQRYYDDYRSRDDDGYHSDDDGSSIAGLLW